ncbi:MAG: hypothetical protein IKI09_10800 [Bacteroidales bacterium]|nr:hypothetical protein [Bacteroidales bacterium]
MAKTVASAAGLTGSLPTAEARSDLASETPIGPRKEIRSAPSLVAFRHRERREREFAEKPFEKRV